MGRVFKIGILAYILADLAFVFYLQFHNVIDGDLVEIVLPTKLYQQVLRNPLGGDVLLHGAKYAGSNGFLGYWLVHNYFRSVPFFFQHFTTPLNSLYLSCALSTVIYKILYLYFLSFFISGEYRIFHKNFLLAALIISPLIQTGGYRWYIGIVDPMLISMFAYSRANLMVLVFFLPFFLIIYHGKKIKFGPVLYTTMILLALYNGYNGPLAGPLVCIIFSFLLLAIWMRNMKENAGLPFIRKIATSIGQIPRYYFVIGIVTVLASLYCYYIGKANVESYVKQVSLWDRYQKLPKGLYEHFASKSLWLLSLMIVLNAVILFYRKHDAQARKTISLMWWILLFSAIYTLMLPLGGYRFYRPNIIRRDVFSPVLIGMIGFYGISTFYLIRNIGLQYKKLYLAFVIMPLAHYALTNIRDIPDNSCERLAIEKIAASKEKIVRLEEQCTIMNWFPVRDYRESKKITDIMKVWGIIKEEKYFYQDTMVNGVRVKDLEKVYF